MSCCWRSSHSVSLLYPATRGPYHTNATLLGLMVYEAALLVPLSAFLYMRGWTLREIGLTPTLKDSGIGVLLFIADYAVWIAVWFATVHLSPDMARTMAGTQVVTAGLSPKPM